MLVLPVIDLLGGQAVHARGGHRHAYQRLRSSVLTDQPDSPYHIVRGTRDNLGTRQCYVADLDAISGAVPDWRTLESLIDLDVMVWADVGLRDAKSIHRLREQPLSQCSQLHWIVALETLVSPTALQTMIDTLPAERLVVSVDLRAGVPQSTWPPWQAAAAVDIAAEIVDLGIRRLIILDLANVGMRQGTGTGTVIRELRQRRGPAIEIVAGGGITNCEQMIQLRQDGANGVLLATSLHDGTIGANEVARIERI